MEVFLLYRRDQSTQNFRFSRVAARVEYSSADGVSSLKISPELQDFFDNFWATMNYCKRQNGHFVNSLVDGVLSLKNFLDSSQIIACNEVD